MMQIRICFLLSYLMVLNISSTASTDTFEEELFVEQLPNGFVYSLFQFTTSWNVNAFEEHLSSHYNLFPRSLGEIVSKFGIAELHLSLTQGRWRYNSWGYPIISAPTGIELWVWFNPSLNASSVDEKWGGLVHALSGQFCSSINFIGKAETTEPRYAFKPLGLWPLNNISPSRHLRYATLPRETVCTENLTPWKKLLPCGGMAGLASLLNAFKLYDSSYHSLAVHLQSTCETDDCEQPMLTLSQTLSSVFDPHHKRFHGGWSLHELFDEKIKRKCPVASSSKVFVNIENLKLDSFSPKPDSLREITLGENTYRVAVYDVSGKETKLPFDMHVDFDLPTEGSKRRPYIWAHKHTTGYGEEHGGSSCIVRNRHPSSNITIAYLDIMPYFVRAYLHTLQVKINGELVEPVNLSFTPAYHRDRPARLEFRLTIPAQSVAVVYMEFEKVFQDWTAHPPDAHHGFYIGSSVISGVIPYNQFSVPSLHHSTSIHRMQNNSVSGDNKSVFRRIYTEALLLRVPLPDFSMPYNVICLTCTVIAITFGSIYNLTTRTFQVELEAEPKTMKEKLTDLLGRFTKKNQQEQKVDDKSSDEKEDATAADFQSDT